MIAFASLFLGLTLGVQPVAVAVGEPAVAAELYLDGRMLARLSGPPWSIPCDFGDVLAPHELVAVGLDAEGQEVARARQWINLPQPPAEATVVLGGDNGGEGRVAHVSWESLTGAEPLRVEASFDGRALEVQDPRTIPLPDYDPSRIHFLRVEVLFTNRVASVAEVTFGGTYADQINTELTAVPVVLERGASLPQPERWSGRLLKAGAPLEVVGVETSPAELVVVRDEAAREELGRLVADTAGFRRFAAPRLGQSTSTGSYAGNGSALRYAMRLKKDQALRFLWPVPRRQAGTAQTFDLFPPSQSFAAGDGGVFWLLSRAVRPVAGPQRLADAVAVAGVSAAGRERRRAVLLVLSGEPHDDSALAPEAVRRYLGSLQVPLVVWSLSEAPSPAARAWGEVVDVSSLTRLEKAVKELTRLLDRQRIVWVNGTHLPQEIELAPGVEGMALAR